jgi:hypothetical protein
VPATGRFKLRKGEYGNVAGQSLLTNTHAPFETATFYGTIYCISVSLQFR